MLRHEILAESHGMNNAGLAAVIGDTAKMSSDDFGQKPSGGWDYGPPGSGGGAGAPGGGPPGQKPPGGWDYGGDGGGDIYGQPGSGGPASIGDVFSNFFMLLKRSFGGILVAFVLIGTISMMCQCPSWTVWFLATGIIPIDVDTTLLLTAGVGSYCTMALGYFGALVVASLQMAMFRPMRIALVQGTDELGGVGGTLKEVFSKFVPAFVVVLITGVVVAIGLMLCVLPGLIAAILMMFVGYLVVATDAGIGEAFGESFRLVKENLVAVLVAIVVLFTVGSLVAGCGWGIMFGAMALTPQYGGLIATITMFFINFTLFIFLNLFMGAFVTTIETSDASVELMYD